MLPGPVDIDALQFRSIRSHVDVRRGRGSQESFLKMAGFSKQIVSISASK
ncbi:MAG: hypothetical protein ABSH28_12640 [Acidobacteriota bacterium]|jgi:hypothetical protein